MSEFKLGLVINPYAGVGGPLAYKGSDGKAAEALARGAELRAEARCLRCLQALSALLKGRGEGVVVYGFAGAMAEAVATEAGFDFVCVGEPCAQPSTADDTVAAARALLASTVDLLLFVGGDGTARDIHAAVTERLPVLGVPAGVKMHSGVYAVSPESAAEIVAALVNGQLVDIGAEEVRDIDEEAFRQGVVKARYYGELQVPRLGQFLQHVKSGGREVEELALADIAADFVERMDDDTLYIIGPGTTTRALMDELGLANTLLGIDAICNGELLGSDLDAPALQSLVDGHRGPVVIVVTAIGGQGHILGRGNQQLSPALIRRVGRAGLMVVATKSKIAELGGRPLLVDTNDAALDRELEGYLPVITGYRDSILYRVSASGA